MDSNVKLNHSSSSFKVISQDLNAPSNAADFSGNILLSSASRLSPEVYVSDETLYSVSPSYSSYSVYSGFEGFVVPDPESDPVVQDNGPPNTLPSSIGQWQFKTYLGISHLQSLPPSYSSNSAYSGTEEYVVPDLE